ncbi:hypothetical protein K3758_07420 [Sulfitobacter sp. W002]|uniref:phage head spike fiber domain-containing protein n=1 Tax=Sulfitobacter sp. W002 TaxID=2867024 RepID=UPI0021A2E9CC|nr:hypothetical protein [Sulfitobacter sp. W002]UWR31323.1 hypothetical protein K3758_07420 [Sulfitobacter sp. W002]
MSTMFQDSAGTVPVAAPGQTVGLMLDKSRGLVKGANVAAAGPTTVFAPWVSLGGGRYSIDGSQTSYQSLYYEGILEVGATYEVTFTVESTTGAIRIASQLNSIDLTGTGEKKAHLVAAAGNFNIQAPPGVVATIEVGEVRKVPGNHLTQPTASKRPIYGVVPKGGRRNLLAYSKELTLARWPSAGTSASFDPSDITAPDGSKTAVRAISGGGGSDYLYRDAVASDGQIKSIYARTVSGTGTVGLLDFNGTPRSETSLTEEWQRFELPVNTADTGGANFYLVDFRVGTLGEVLIWGPQLEEGSEATPYQRVGNQYDVTERGVETLHYLYFDGVDDELAASRPLPFSTELFSAIGFRLDSYNNTFPNMLSNRGASTGAGRRHPLIYARQSNPTSLVLDIEDTPLILTLSSELPGRDIVMGGGFGSGQIFAEADGVSQSAPGAVPTELDTDPFKISGGNRFEGRFYGAAQVNKVPPASKQAALRRWLNRKSGVTL